MSTTKATDTDKAPMDVIKNEALARFEIHIGDEVAFLRYAEEPGRIHLVHTEVPEKLSGRGIAGRLAAFALDDARARGLRVIPSCPYVHAYMGEVAAAIEGLERCLEEKDPYVVFTAMDPAFAALRGDPRFQSVLARIGLPFSPPPPATARSWPRMRRAGSDRR